MSSETDQREFKKTILDVFHHALLPLNLDDASPDSNNVDEEDKLRVEFTDMHGQGFSRRLVKALGASKDLIQRYNKLAAVKPHESRVDNIKNTFSRDKQAALAMLAAGRKVATVDIQNMLVDRYHEAREKTTVTQADGINGQMLLSKGKGEDHVDADDWDGSTWGELAADTRKAVDKLGRVGSK
jgi:hypothetical protein